uniref:Jacalin-type lectin domain-containing protein n=1 Tax=Oryza brachyantha TaxID=4533 RepID=J3NCA3_ORYBR
MQIEFASSEFLIEVSRTFGTYEGASVITSIKFVTNLKTHGPFGQQNGTPFTVPVKDNSSIVGFFGRGGKYLDALGVYVHPIPQNASAAAPLYECRLNKIRYG